MATKKPMDVPTDDPVPFAGVLESGSYRSHRSSDFQRFDAACPMSSPAETLGNTRGCDWSKESCS